MPGSRPRGFRSNLRDKNGAGEEIRTPDLLITSELLYLLSYAGVTKIIPEKPPSVDHVRWFTTW